MSGAPVDGQVEPELPTPAQLKKGLEYQLTRLRNQFNKLPSSDPRLSPFYVDQQLVDAAREAFDATEKVRILYELATERESAARLSDALDEKRRLIKALEGIKW